MNLRCLRHKDSDNSAVCTIFPENYPDNGALFVSIYCITAYYIFNKPQRFFGLLDFPKPSMRYTVLIRPVFCTVRATVRRLEATTDGIGSLLLPQTQPEETHSWAIPAAQEQRSDRLTFFRVRIRRKSALFRHPKIAADRKTYSVKLRPRSHQRRVPPLSGPPSSFTSSAY